MLFAIHMIDRPGTAELRLSLREEHLAFVDAHRDSIFLGGPMRDDEDEFSVGSLVIMEFPDREAARAMLTDEPYYRAGLFESVTIRAFQPLISPT